MNPFFPTAAPPPPDTFHRAACLVIGLAVAAVFAAVFLNFWRCSRPQGVKQERRSLVATGTMTLFFAAFTLLIHYRIGALPLPPAPFRLAAGIPGLALVVLGCAVNLLGRLRLGANWANQATIYTDQKLVVSGIYGWVRHPLYASLIWMFFGACLVFPNLAAFLATALVFVPFMYRRARLEELLLAREFPEYAGYQRRTGMFFPKWPRPPPTPNGESS